jgi:hypothetical protein
MKSMERFFIGCMLFEKKKNPTPYLQEDFEYLLYQFGCHLFLIEFEVNVTTESNCSIEFS